MNNHGIFSPNRTKVGTLLSIKSIFLFLLFTFAFEIALYGKYILLRPQIQIKW